MFRVNFDTKIVSETQCEQCEDYYGLDYWYEDDPATTEVEEEYLATSCMDCNSFGDHCVDCGPIYDEDGEFDGY